jgi:DNA-binding transcriptional MerR regulator/methylmalonyl-CoA mutase cobalamin-binding subunit
VTPTIARRTEAAAGARLSIGALSRATGIPVETLRTWENRYGYPVPERKPSGHRVYALASVPRLRRIAEALSRGHRAGEVVRASDGDLEALLGATPDATPEPAPVHAGAAETVGIPELLETVERFDADRLTRILLGDWARLGPLGFLETRIVPLICAVGSGWEEGKLEIRHEHFLSERIGDLLRSLRLPFEERAHGPLVVLGSLPGEAHALGLQMAALVLSAGGCRVLFLGTEVPVPEMAALAKDMGARAVALSVSSATRGAATSGHIRRLREMLPKRVRLLVGGEGAPKEAPGFDIIHDLSTLDAWSRRLQAEAATAS